MARTPIFKLFRYREYVGSFTTPVHALAVIAKFRVIDWTLRYKRYGARLYESAKDGMISEQHGLGVPSGERSFTDAVMLVEERLREQGKTPIEPGESEAAAF